MLKRKLRSVQFEKIFWLKNRVGDYFWIRWEQFPEELAEGEIAGVEGDEVGD